MFECVRPFRSLSKTNTRTSIINVNEHGLFGEGLRIKLAERQLKYEAFAKEAGTSALSGNRHISARLGCRFHWSTPQNSLKTPAHLAAESRGFVPPVLRPGPMLCEAGSLLGHNSLRTSRSLRLNSSGFSSNEFGTPIFEISDSPMARFSSRASRIIANSNAMRPRKVGVKRLNLLH